MLEFPSANLHCSNSTSQVRSIAMTAAATRTLLPVCAAGPARALRHQRAAFSVTRGHISSGRKAARCSAAGPAGAAAGGPAPKPSSQRDYKVALITGGNTGERATKLFKGQVTAHAQAPFHCPSLPPMRHILNPVAWLQASGSRLQRLCCRTTTTSCWAAVIRRRQRRRGASSSGLLTNPSMALCFCLPPALQLAAFDREIAPIAIRSPHMTHGPGLSCHAAAPCDVGLWKSRPCQPAALRTLQATGAPGPRHRACHL